MDTFEEAAEAEATSVEETDVLIDAINKVIEEKDLQHFFGESTDLTYKSLIVSLQLFNFFNLRSDPDGTKFQTMCELMSFGVPLKEMLQWMRFLSEKNALKFDCLAVAFKRAEIFSRWMGDKDEEATIKMMNEAVADRSALSQVMKKHGVENMLQLDNMLTTANQAMKSSLTKPESKENASRGLSLFKWGKKD